LADQLTRYCLANSWKCKILDIQFENEIERHETNHDFDTIFFSENERTRLWNNYRLVDKSLRQLNVMVKT
jgi:hypothetical protein